MNKFLLLLSLYMWSSNTKACTIIITNQNGTVRIANNEDWFQSNAKYWFEETGKHNQKIHSCFFGFKGDGRFPQGGMNDKGLFFDGTFISKIAVDKAFVKEHQLKKAPFMIFRNILKSCSDIPSTKERLKNYYFPFLEDAQVVMADGNGAYLIIKANGIVEEGLVDKDSFKIITNFHLEGLVSNNYTCYRYDLAKEFLSTQPVFSEQQLIKALDLTHQEYPAATVYSNIYDLEKKQLILFYNNDFSQPHTIDIKQDFRKGDIKIESLFKQRMIDELAKQYTKGGLTRAMAFFNQPNNYQVDAEQLVDFSEYLFINRKGNDYEKVLEKVSNIYPNQDVVYQALGKFQLRKGNIDLAILHYEKALSLNKNNWWAKDMLEQYKTQPNCTTTLKLEGYSNAASVKVEGEFNEWMPIRNVCRLEKGVWATCIRAKPSQYKYQFIVDGVAVKNTNHPKDAAGTFSILVIEE